MTPATTPTADLDWEERRVEPRLACHFAAHMYLVGGADLPASWHSLVLVLDITHRGARVLCPISSRRIEPHQVHPGQDARLFLHSTESTARLDCRIAWVTQNESAQHHPFFEIGVHFQGPEKDLDHAAGLFVARGLETRVERGDA